MRRTLILGGAFGFWLMLTTNNSAQEADSLRRAGNPQEISRFAVPSNTLGHNGSIVGGGSIAGLRGDPPLPDEGTWGWDYKGLLLPRKINLLWWHDRRKQGGIGAYKTDGPKLPPLHQEGPGGMLHN